MTHVKESEIIPLLKIAKAGYTEIILREDPAKVEMAEQMEAALTQAMDIVYDYQTMAEQYREMMDKYETEQPVIDRGHGIYQCPACGKRTGRHHTHCHWCGKKLGWNT